MILFGTPERNFDGLEKAVGPATITSLAPALSGNWWGWLREPFSGAWQRNIEAEQPTNIMAFSAAYACVTLVADDIAKLRIKLVEDPNGIPTEVTLKDRNTPFLRVLRKPNRYQTRIQFLQQWMASKLMHGNAYVLKDRDDRGVVSALYPLNPFNVTPFIANDGSVYYQIAMDWLAGILQVITVPASEIIHDRCTALWHPLVGVSPLYASGASSTQGIRIQANSKTFFENMSRPSGQLTAPGTIDDVTAARFKKEFEENFSKGNIGRLLVTGDGLKYEPMTYPPIESQLIEQLKWTVEDVARAHKVPLYKIGGAAMPGLNVSALNQDYYNQALQIHIEGIEQLLLEGLELPQDTYEYGVELDLDGLLRMDPIGRADTYAKLISCAVYAPNEARFREGLAAVEGGETPYLQQQNYSLAALARRDKAQPAPPMAPNPQAGPVPPGAPPVVATPPAKSEREAIEGEFLIVEEDDVLAFEKMVHEEPLLIDLAEAA